MNKVFVVAGTRQQAYEWIKHTGLMDYSFYGQDIRYVRDAYQLRGVSDAAFVFTGTWYERKDAQEIHDEAVWMIKSGRGYILNGS